jgi:hypothetical protein
VVADLRGIRGLDVLVLEATAPGASHTEIVHEISAYIRTHSA